MVDVLLITGAAGTGKTSTAQAWAASRHMPAAHLSHDTISLFVQSGFVSPAQQVSSEAERQWRIAIDICVAASHVYAAAQMQCAIDTFLLPSYLPFWNNLAPLHVGVVVLHPPVDLAVTRNAIRLEQTGWGVPEWQLRANHTAMMAWIAHPEALVIDPSSLDRAQVVAAIDTWLEQRAQSSG